MGSTRSRTGPQRWALGPRAPAPIAKTARLVAAAGVALAVAVSLGPWIPAVRAVAALALVVAAAAFHHALSRQKRLPRGWLVADGRGIGRTGAGGDARLVDWGEPFGATVLARADRRAFTLALTSPRATRLVPVRVEPSDAARLTTLGERAITVAESDLRRDDEVSLTASDAERVLAAIAARAPAALDRVYLFDADGDAIVLDRAELRVGPRRIDLASPVEWRAFVFQEQGAQSTSVCQATWVRQGDGEVVLVAPMPADGAWLEGAPDVGYVQAAPGDPPPRELRRAIDHVFMPAVRRALARAPRLSRMPSSPGSPPSQPMPRA